MILIYSFIGRLPSYIIETVYQLRLYFNGDIYLILDDLESVYLKKLINEYSVKLINYYNLKSGSEEITELEKNFNKFLITKENGDRELLFYRSFERLFLINQLIKLLNLKDVISLELDNLIYDNPTNWLKELQKKELAFMLSSKEHCSCGVIYIKDDNSLKPLIKFMLEYINKTQDYYCSEMKCLYEYIYNINKEDSQLLPVIFKSDTDSLIENDDLYKNYDNYESIFDPSFYGIYLLGKDLIHTNGELKLYQDYPEYYIRPAIYEIKWMDKEGLRRPYIYNKNKDKWILINNLHVHSKRLELGLSRPVE